MQVWDQLRQSEQWLTHKTKQLLISVQKEKLWMGSGLMPHKMVKRSSKWAKCTFKGTIWMQREVHFLFACFFLIIINIYLFNFLVPVGMLWKAQSPEVNSAQTTSKDSGWFCGPLWCTVCENKVVPVHFTFALWLKNLTLTVLMYLQFYVTSQKENK